jgi:alkyl hydroperoxide reductase subunit AhpC
VNVANPNVGFNPLISPREERQDWHVLQVKPFDFALVSAQRARDFQRSYHRFKHRNEQKRFWSMPTP